MKRVANTLVLRNGLGNKLSHRIVVERRALRKPVTAFRIALGQPRPGHRTTLCRLAQLLAVVLALVASPARATLCGATNYPFPFTDVGGVTDAFCVGILQAYVIGMTRGTTATTFTPDDNVSRLQMTTFLQRSFDQGLKRSHRRAALGQWWTPKTPDAMQTLSNGGAGCTADGDHVWLSTGGFVRQFHASTGRPVNGWTVPLTGTARSPLVVGGRVFAVLDTQPGALYLLDPSLPGSGDPMTLAASNLGDLPRALAFDGAKFWTANAGGSVSIVTLQSTTPYPVTTVTTGFSAPIGAIYDGTNVWITDNGADRLFRLDAAGAIVQTVVVGGGPGHPVFDGTNIWVPNFEDDSITVVQASSGGIVATISADLSNQLSGPLAASFDGERIIVTSIGGITLFKAADLRVAAYVQIPDTPIWACSDGAYFWITRASGPAVRL